MLSTRGELARTQALHPVTRGGCAASLSTLISKASPSTLESTNLPEEAVYTFRHHATLESNRLLDTLVRRCEKFPSSPLTTKLKHVFKTDTTLQLTLANSTTPSPSRTFLSNIPTPTPSSSPLSPLLALVDNLEQHDTTPAIQNARHAYKMSEVDALFFDAIEADSELAHRVWRLAPESPELYHETLQTRLATRGGLATRIADATIQPQAAIIAADHLSALTALIDSPPDETLADPDRLALFHSECARAIANIASNATSPDLAKRAAANGILARLAHWALSERLDGILSAQARRAIANLDRRREAARYVDGVLPLHVGEEGKEIDVVFIHGLDGSPLLTWRAQSAQNGHDDLVHPPDQPHQIWPRDWLPLDAANVRVLSVAHEAGVFRGLRPGRSMQERSVWLRNALRDAKVGCRPVVFVGHSYGGLLVKEAMLLDDEIWKRTAGVLFFATPHRGSFAASAGANGFVFSKAVTELRREDGALGDLHERFLKKVRMDGMEVWSFVEERPMVGRGGFKMGLLVEERSADCGVGNVIKLDVDHVGVCKVGRRSDARYRILVDVVRRAGGRKTKAGYE